MKWRGVWKLARPLPLAIWSVPTVFMGFLLQTHSAARPRGLVLGLTLLAAMILQGVVTHGLNDLYDWDSGTDKETTGIISGGSRVLAQGLLSVRQIWMLVIVGSFIYAAISWYIFTVRGWGVLLWAGLGLFGAVSYSLPPLRFSYRPFAGEWGALFPTMASGVLLGAIAKNATMSAQIYVGAAIYGIYCVASVMQHHLADMEADWNAHPRKRTTPAYWWLQRHRSPLQIITGYEAVAMAVALGGAMWISSVFVPWIAVAAVALAITYTTPLHKGPWPLTRRDLALKLLAVAGVLSIIR